MENRMRAWDPVDLLVPEWNYLQRDPIKDRHEDEASGLTLTKKQRDPDLVSQITRVLAVERLRKVNALVGFTRIDAVDRVGDFPRRLAPLTRNARPTWTVATEDRGEGIFLQLAEADVAAWEAKVLGSELWEAHRQSHRRNFYRHFSETAKVVDPDTRFCCVMASETSCERANGSSTGVSSSTCRGVTLGSSAAASEAAAARRLGELLTGTEARGIADRLADGDTLSVALSYSC